jgi:hypothetical protein
LFDLFLEISPFFSGERVLGQPACTGMYDVLYCTIFDCWLFEGNR